MYGGSYYRGDYYTPLVPKCSVTLTVRKNVALCLGLFVQDTLYNTTVNKLEAETQHRQRLELKLAETMQELQDAHTKLKSKEKLAQGRKKELEKLRATVSRNQKLLKEYDNVTELSKMKNELRKMR